MAFHAPSILSRSTTLAAGCAGLALAGATPVHAGQFLLSSSPAALALVVETSCSTIGTQAAADVVPSTLLSGQVGKRAAILGGEMSALDRMRLAQQQPEVVTVAVAPQVAAVTLQPGAGGLREIAQSCLSRNKPGRLAVLPKPLPGASPEDFLASKRTRIGKTGFDADWRRVRSERPTLSMRRVVGTGAAVDIATVERVNAWVNTAITFVEDRDLFGKADFWAGGRRTMQLGKGDCEDIAITKMQLLAAAGFSRDDMFLTIARDRVRNADHALLVVRVGGRFVVLDNTTSELLDAGVNHDYAPVLSFSNRTAWMHGY
ncbi:transglutaminase-like cysteine peptidase [Parerythrobacter aurantius]|uniref:transglutaminase-like cysteine peptidase n=1 Tax=Parerythrobacter aurantius TaxID=3127706 RepID=UPI00324F485D